MLKDARFELGCLGENETIAVKLYIHKDNDFNILLNWNLLLLFKITIIDV